jgi:hypothetical protein
LKQFFVGRGARPTMLLVQRSRSAACQCCIPVFPERRQGKPVPSSQSQRGASKDLAFGLLLKNIEVNVAEDAEYSIAHVFGADCARK